MQGNTYYHPVEKNPMPLGKSPLTPREMQVLRLLCRHMTNSEIAAALFISENTVKFHNANMQKKTGFANSVDLAFHVITHGWVNPLY